MISRPTGRAISLVALAAALLTTAVAANPFAGTTAPARAASTDRVELFAGCNNVAVTWPVGTPIDTVAMAVTPAGALESIFRYDNQQAKYFGYSPLPAAREAGVNDYTSITRFLEPVFVCMREAGELNRPDA